MHSYQIMYDSGRDILRGSSETNKKITLKFGERAVERPLNKITYHARDVYPELLRSTLLVRLVAGYEAFLVDVVEEVSRRSMTPFFSDGRVEFSQEQLLTIDREEGIQAHIVKRTLRGLTSGGLKEIRRFYEKRLQIDVVANPADFPKIEEIHQRRHLYVHRAGYADTEYVKKFSGIGIRDDARIPVPERYLNDAINLLEASAFHIKRKVEAAFPAPPLRKYVYGDLDIPEVASSLQFISFEPISSGARDNLTNLSFDLGEGTVLRDIISWQSYDGVMVRMIIGGTEAQMRCFWKWILGFEKGGDLRRLDSFKIKRH